jgi:hypothetical protein
MSEWKTAGHPRPQLACPEWSNGQHVASHEGGQTPFSADITEALNTGGEQVLVIRAEDDPTDLTQPRGKQAWCPEPHKIWYHRTTGIWQPVWLESVGAVHIANLRWTPEPDWGVVGVRAELRGWEGRSLRLQVTLTLHDQTLADDQYAAAGGVIEREIALDPAAIHGITTRHAASVPGDITAKLQLTRGTGALVDAGAEDVGHAATL